MENTTQQKTELNFGQALEWIKLGQRVQRIGWNGKGMFVYLNMGSVDLSTMPPGLLFIDGIRTDLFVEGDKDTVTRLPNLNMHSATGATVTGWLASQTDVLAEDWQVVE